VKLSLCLTKYHGRPDLNEHHAIKTNGGVEVQLHSFLISALHADV
jgi:hypothetical protein